MQADREEPCTKQRTDSQVMCFQKKLLMLADVVERPRQALTLCGCNLLWAANHRRTKARTDQEMGGFRLSAGNALAKRVLPRGSGRTDMACGGLNKTVPAKATVWQI